MSLLAFRCAHASKVGVLRAALSLWCFACATHWANAHPPHASRSRCLTFYLVFIHILALPRLMVIIKYLQG
ncbi:MAG: hypothetical protein NZ455_15865 [Bacteroidia bacterium]|nr:hypothetical protein [Bacteroidia bacterium]